MIGRAQCVFFIRWAKWRDGFGVEVGTRNRRSATPGPRSKGRGVNQSVGVDGLDLSHILHFLERLFLFKIHLGLI